MSKIKERFNNLAFKKRFDRKIEKKDAQKAQQNKTIQYGLAHPEEPKAHRTALRMLATRETSENLTAFGKWVVIQLLWLVPPYFAYGMYQSLLNNILIQPKISGKILWGAQQQLNLAGLVVAAVLLLCGNQMIKKGWYHRPHKKGSLAKEMTASLKQDPNKK